MNQLAEALKKIPESSDVGQMVKKSDKKLKKEIKLKKKKKAVAQKKRETAGARAFYQGLRLAAEQGFMGLRPCSLLDWRPGAPVKADGQPGRIKWGLTDQLNVMRLAVVAYEYPQKLQRTGDTVYHGVVGVEKLCSCDCQGYTHPSCRPKQ